MVRQLGGPKEGRSPAGPARFAVVLAALATAGCAGATTGTVGREVSRATLPAFSLTAPRYASDPSLERFDPPPTEEWLDELLASPMLRDSEFNDAVSTWVEYWTGAASSAVPVFLDRMASFEETVDRALERTGLPKSLRYLPFIESGYNPRATSRASAVGMWQFMAPTARGFGLEVGPLVDQRRDPVLSTGAALRFLGDLRSEFGSWFLALAAYNSGPNRVRRILARYAPEEPGSDSLFWALRGHFPRETRDFVPKLIAAAQVASDPSGYGYREPMGVPFLFDRVTVPDATTLDVVASASATSQEEIERLNPEYVRGMTPPGRESPLRVPAGRGGAFEAAYARIPRDERVSFVEHRVSEGETLSHIAVAYGIRVSDLEAANPGVRPRYLRIGARLTVPVAPSARRQVSEAGS